MDRNMDDSRNVHEIKDQGPQPLVVNIDELAQRNRNFRTALWTGKYLQTTLMSLKVGEDIGAEMHSNLDQFIRIEDGFGLVKMGNSRDNLNSQMRVNSHSAIFIPAGTWHNLVNIGNRPLKLYSIYAPPAHPFGTVHQTKEIAEQSESSHR